MKYFIAYALGDGERDAVDALRCEIAERAGVRAALQRPPHLTLFRAFEHPYAAPLVPALDAAASKLSPFPLPTPRFAAFGEATWFVDVDQDPRLFRIREAVRAAVRSSVGIDEECRSHGTHFHITLASKDVTPDAFRRIGSFLKRRPVPVERVVVDSFTLFEHRGGEWREVRTFPFTALA